MQKEFNEQLENTAVYRNGYTKKKVKTEYGDVDIKVPRDRESKFEPEILAKRQTTSNGIKDQVTSMYAKGMSTRNISDHIEALYGTTLSANTISTMTDEALLKGKEWFSRTLDKVYPIVFMDAVHFKVKDEHKIVTKAAYIALGINMEGQKEILGV